MGVAKKGLPQYNVKSLSEKKQEIRHKTESPRNTNESDKQIIKEQINKIQSLLKNPEMVKKAVSIIEEMLKSPK